MAAAAADAAASSLGVGLGLSDPTMLGLDEFKVEAQAISTLQVGKKRPKVNHGLFFENDGGLKKMLKTFPKIKLAGKGREYEDLSLVLQHYKKWFADLYPYGDHFEDIVLKARQVLEDPEKDDDGTVSNPKEKLHAFRFQYKNAPARPQLSDEARARIEANRKKAMEIKRQREGGAAPSVVEEVDMEDLWRKEEERAAAERRQGTSQGPPPGGFNDEEEEDPFGFGGGGFDNMDSVSGAPTRAAAAPAFDDEEEDVFGFGGGFDDFGGAPAAKPPQVPVAVAKPAVDPEVAKRIAENRAKALERKAAAAKAAATVVDDTPAAVDGAPDGAATAADGTVTSEPACPPELAAAAVAGAAPEVADAPHGAAPMLEEDDDFGDDFGFGGGGFDDA